MEFDAGRRELIEAVLEPLSEQEEARKALQVAAAGAVGLLGSTRELEIPAAAARMKKSALRFMAVRKWSAIAMAATMTIVLWFSFLSPGAW
ncbi:MAG: hypothetical protein JWO82_1368, partial [Akkermansiaceae bacterium]|nr:hypothetical protein [Akkermansiaceae bacterium]